MLYRVSTQGGEMEQNDIGIYEGVDGHRGYEWCASKREVASIVRERVADGGQCEVESFSVPKDKAALVWLLNGVASHADNG